MPTLFTFGCGPHGELGHAQPPDAYKHPEATPVAFPTAAGAIEAVALGTDHSLAVAGGQVFRWGLLGAHAVPRGWRGGRWEGSADGSPRTAKPEVVPAPLLLDRGGGRSGRSTSPRKDRAASPSPSRKQGGVGAAAATIACGGSNSFVTRQGEVFLFGGLWPPGGDPGQLRHVWGAAQGGPASRVAQVAAGWRHVLFLTEAGCIFALGDDDFGQCAGSGGGTAAIPLPSSAMAVGVAAGACHSLAWDATGAAFAWGHGGSGRLGLGGACKRPSPQRVDLAKPVCAASAGANFSLFVVNSGEELFACGGNQYGQLGIDASQAFTPVSVQIPLAEDEVITAVESGTNHVICLTQTDGDPADSQATVWAWGCASSGQCGPNAAFESQARPLKLGDFSPPSPHRAVAVAAGRSHSAVLAFTGNTARSRLRPRARTPRASAEKSVRPRAERSEQAEDIIEEFLTGLAREPLASLTAAARSPSPGVLVTMAEEALFMGEGVTEKVRNPTSELSSRLGGRLIRRSGQGQQENRRSAGRRPRREQRAPNPKPPTPKPTEPSVSKASRTKPGLGTGALLAEALAAEDQWSGIRESLKGLSSYIAQLSDTPVKAPLASWAPVPAVVQPGVGAMGTAFAPRSEPPKATPLASELREPPPADSPLRPVRAQSFEKDADDAQAELSDAQLNFSPQTEDTEDQSQPWLLSDEVQDRQDIGKADDQGSSSPTNAKEEWWQQQLLAQQRESEERTRTLRESTLASLQSPSSQEAKEASASKSPGPAQQETSVKTAPAAATLSPPAAPPRLPDLRSLEQSPGTSLSRTRQSMSSGDVDAILANLSNDEESTEDEVSGDWV